MTQFGMHFETMPQIIVKENIFFSKIILLNTSSDEFFKRNRIKYNPEWIHRTLEFMIPELLPYIFGKTRA